MWPSFKLFNLSEPQFLQLYLQDNNYISLIEMLWIWNKIMQDPVPAQRELPLILILSLLWFLLTPMPLLVICTREFLLVSELWRPSYREDGFEEDGLERKKVVNFTDTYNKLQWLNELSFSTWRRFCQKSYY